MVVGPIFLDLGSFSDRFPIDLGPILTRFGTHFRLLSDFSEDFSIDLGISSHGILLSVWHTMMISGNLPNTSTQHFPSFLSLPHKLGAHIILRLLLHTTELRQKGRNNFPTTLAPALQCFILQRHALRKFTLNSFSCP